jgi:hypothetical protein
MGAYANRMRAAFLLACAVRRLPEGDVAFSIVLYGVDDHRLTGGEWHLFPDDETARTEVRRIAREFTHPSKFTPSDTPIIYSLLLPGSGQLLLGEPFHAVVSAGLVGAAFLTKVDVPANSPEIRRKHARNKRTLLIISAWLLNLADTAALVHFKLKKVDAAVFYTMVVAHQPPLWDGLRPDRFRPGLYLTISFR